MSSEIISDILVLPKNKCADNIALENELSNIYGDIVRWAVISVENDICKVSVSYIKSN